MEKLFVPYELAVKLKELGFAAPCLGGYDINNKWWYHPDSDVIIDVPLWEQAFDWFRDRYSLHTEIRSYTAERFTFVIQELKNTVKYIEYGGINNIFKTYEEARQACLEKLIILIENETI